MFNRIITSITIAAAITVFAAAAFSQEKTSVKTGTGLFEIVKMAREGRVAADPANVAAVREAYEQATEKDSLLIFDIVGTWNCHIQTSTGGSAPFDALQTFVPGGTFVETSSLLGTGTEGPAQGVWLRSRTGYILTFELFVFDPATGDVAGRVRVRNSIRMNNQNSFTSINVVDFIDLDGTVIEGIDSGIYTGFRMGIHGI